MTISVRLENDLLESLIKASQTLGLSKSEVIKQSLRQFLDNLAPQKSSYELTEPFIGMVNSGRTDGSVNYKKYVRQYLEEKHNRRRS